MEVRILVPKLREADVWLAAAGLMIALTGATTKEPLAVAGRLADFVLAMYKARNYQFEDSRGAEVVIETLEEGEGDE